MNPNRSNALAWWSAATILVSAFLLFQVQPVITKKILPWFGGSPAVWTTCVLFFQLVLLGGYAYAHWLTHKVEPRWQGVVHLAIVLVAVLTLPIVPWEWWKPKDGDLPALRILRLLTFVVGVPYFVLSTTGPLVQAWFARLYPGRSPYRLYSLSNVGSLAALLTYPFLVETSLRVDNQGYLWSLLFVAFAGLIGILALSIWRLSDATNLEAAGEEPPITAADGLVTKRPNRSAEAIRGSAKPEPDVPPSASLRMSWLLLAALASTAFLAITNHLCQDIAVVPFMWVIPLSLYLLSFIICFDNERWYLRKTFGAATIVMILWLTAVQNYTSVNSAFEWIQKPVKGWKIGTTNHHVELPVTFSRMNDNLFDAVGWVVARIDDGLQRTIKPKTRLSFDVATYEFKEHVFVVSAAYMLALFLICMVCHGELVKSKPQPKYLTSFYLSISAGGALGGLFVALICPLVFKTHFELAIAIVGGFIVGWLTIFNDGRDGWLKGREILQWSLAFVLVGTTLFAMLGNKEDIEIRRLAHVLPDRWQAALMKWKVMAPPDPDLIAIERNFYGTITVTRMGDDDDPYNAGKALYNGRIWHGFQYTSPERELEPSTYYVSGTGAALAVQENPRAGEGLRIAVIGLGSGSMAAHSKPGDTFRFYDIDPKVLKVANEQFTYLRKSAVRGAKIEVVMGDARLSLERELKETGPLNYDVIHLDAFSGDAIPAHLLTDEAFDLYEKHLRHEEKIDEKTNEKIQVPMGIVVVHISNRYLDLEPVVAAISKKHGYTARSVHKMEEGGPTDTASDWVLVTKNEAFLNNPRVQEASEPLQPDKELLWTDQFTALFPIMK